MRDGMDIINFSGGGPQADPRTDVLIEAVANVVRAGVVPIISAGNDRDFFGLGTAGSPATAPDAISVGATANAHVFGPSITVRAPGGVARIPFGPADTIPPSWISTDQRLVDVGTIGGANRQLCDGSLAAGSLRNAIALVSRGGCPYSAKEARAREAGAAGLVIAENRPGDPTFALFSGLPGGTISDLDGARIRAAAAGNGGAVTVRFSREISEVPTTWAGVPTSFSAGGLTPFGHALKPDVMGPGAQILSSTLPEFAGDQYAILDGTSFSAPHIAGVAALLTQRHPSWTPDQMKSALMSTAGPSYADTSLTQEASVIVQGAGMVRVSTADKPLIFSVPQSLSFGYLTAGGGANAKTIPVTISDGGDGAGTWTAEIQPQVASAGATVEAAPVTIGPGGSAVMQITARAAGGAVQGDNFGFVLLKRGSDVRRIPYAFRVSRSSLLDAPVTTLKTSAVRRHADRRGSCARLPLADVAVLDPRHLRRRPGGERRRQGEDLLARHRAPGRQRGRRRRQARAEAGRLHHRAAELEPADSSVVHGLARRERRPRLRRDPGQRERTAFRTSSTRSELREACSCRRGATTCRSTRGATCSTGGRSPAGTRFAPG